MPCCVKPTTDTPQSAGKGRLAITYFAKEGLQGLVVACSCCSPLARHVSLYPGSLQGTAGPNQAQVCQPFLDTALVMQEPNCNSAVHAFTPCFVHAPLLAPPHSLALFVICLLAYAFLPLFTFMHLNQHNFACPYSPPFVHLSVCPQSNAIQ